MSRPLPQPSPRAAIRLTAIAILSATLLPVYASKSFGDNPEKSPDVTAPPALGEFLVVPLRLHVLTAEDCPDLDTRSLSDDDLRRIVGKVNRIWNVAGIHFGLESIVREKAEAVSEYKEAKEKAEGKAVALGEFRRIRPKASREFDGFHVYYIHKFSVNGVYLGGRVAFVQETAALRPVPGGIDEPLPRVTAHELGHGLSLPHRQDRTNLLASGTTGTKLNRDEVERTRKAAKALKATKTVSDLEREAADADKAGDQARAGRIRAWLSEIPKDPHAGSGSTKSAS